MRPHYCLNCSAGLSFGRCLCVDCLRAALAPVALVELVRYVFGWLP